MSKDIEEKKEKKYNSITLHVSKERRELERRMDERCEKMDVVRSEVVWKLIEMYVEGKVEVKGLESLKDRRMKKLQAKKEKIQKMQEEIRKMEGSKSV